MALDLQLEFAKGSVAGLSVQRYTYQAALNELFELVVDICSTDAEIAVDALLGYPVRVHLGSEPLLREISGIVRRVRQLSAEPWGASLYELTIVPPLWLTTRRRDHRIFQRQTVPEIVKQVLAGYGGRIPEPKVMIAWPKPAREYCVQYGETDCDFVFRILAEDGIVAWFEPADGFALRLTDDATARGGTPPSVLFRPPSSALAADGVPRVLSVEISSDIETSAATVRDFDFEKPAYVLDQTQAAEASRLANEVDLATYDYAVGRFKEDDEGKALAGQILEEARSLRRVLRCETDFALEPGSHFTITDHPRSDVNDDLLVVRMQLFQQWKEGGETRRCSLVCIPSRTRYRPPRKPKPRIHGTQTALVVGDEGEEIHTDAYGRVKLAFRWDRRDLQVGSPTRYVRVSQAWAGAGLGFVALPRVNDEVVVAYLDGDPDEPLVVGRVHNALHTTPLNLPADKTKAIWRSSSSPGGGGYNQIMMEDQAGGEKLEIHAQRDFQQSTGRDSTIAVGHDATRSVSGHDSISVGGNQGVSVTGAQSFTSASHANSSGTISMSAREKMTLHAGASIESDAQAISESATGKITEQAPLIFQNGTVISMAHGGAMLLLSAGAYAGLSSGGVTVVSSPKIVVSGGTQVEVTAPNVTIGAGSKVSVDGAEVKVSGGKVEVGGGAAVTVAAGKVAITGEAEVSLEGGTVNIG